MGQSGSVADKRPAARWAKTSRLLLAAYYWLPVPGNDGSGDFQDYLAHNELGLAFDVLVEVGRAQRASHKFWATLNEAAESMGVSPHDAIHGGSVTTLRELDQGGVRHGTVGGRGHLTDDRGLAADQKP
jgi:hypothetical protein